LSLPPSTPPPLFKQAPEILQSNDPRRSVLEPKDASLKGYGPAADAWAAGVLACELMTGRAPFHSRTEYGTVEQILQGVYAPPDYLSPQARGFIKSALNPDPEQRATVEDLLHSELLHMYPAPVRTLSPTRPARVSHPGGGGGARGQQQQPQQPQSGHGNVIRGLTLHATGVSKTRVSFTFFLSTIRRELERGDEL
jgi:serine/threonine protein kinase